MRESSRISSVIAAVTLVLLAVPTAAQEPKTNGQKTEVTKSELKISPDGRAIVDERGEIFARFDSGVQVRTLINKGVRMSTKDVSVKIPGCRVCYRECVIYEGTRCVQWMTTCDWDFDC
jgi:hypothetical protein